jgi:hypothetical protein
VQQQLLDANDSYALGIADLLARHNVEKRERTREKLFSEIEDSVSALVRLAYYRQRGLALSPHSWVKTNILRRRPAPERMPTRVSPPCRLLWGSRRRSKRSLRYAPNSATTVAVSLSGSTSPP